MCQHQYWREKGWVRIILQQRRGQKTEFLYQCGNTVIGGKSAGYSPVPEQRPENSARNGVAPLLEGKALGTVLQQSKGQKRGFCINMAAPLLEGKVHGDSPVPEQRPENRAGSAPLLFCLQQSRGQKKYFCVNVAAPLLGGKRLVQFYTRAKARKQRYKWGNTITGGKSNAAEQRPENRILYQCVSTSIGGKRAGYVLYYSREEAKKLNFCINVATPLTEEKALGTILYQSRGQKTALGMG
jgi:hypothetical protein